MAAQLFQKDNCQQATKWHLQNVSETHPSCGLFFSQNTSPNFDSTMAFNISQNLPSKLSASSISQKLSRTASGIMRLLRQISLDGNILRHSAFNKASTPEQAEKLGQNFARHFTDTITLTSSLLAEIKLSREQDAVAETEANRKANKDKSADSVLKVLEELNSLIVFLIRQSSDGDKTTQKSNGKRSKSKLRRQYSAFVESDQFQWIRRSLSRQDSDGSSSDSASSSPPKSGTQLELDESQFVSQHGCSLEEAIRKLIDSQILSQLLEALPRIGFEEKKMVRIIFTNSMILEANKNHLVVDYVSDTSTGLLRGLIQSYEMCQSDVTLNCGAILRFASQYKSIVTAIFTSDLVEKFFEYMKKCPSSCPFDVSMDCSYTFKTILTRHKQTTISILQSNPFPFFEAIIQLLKYADETENYVTKRQTLEIFADIFSGSECDELREQLVTRDCHICAVIVYLWDRNLQIRLRCLVLLNQLFRTPKEGASVSVQTKSESHDHDLEENRSDEKEVEPVVPEASWRIALFLETVALTRQRCLERELSSIGDTLRELRDECIKSNVRHFTSQLPFIDKLIDSLKDN